MALKDTLYMTDTTPGHNKYYKMTDLGNGTFDAEYASILARSKPPHTVYDMDKWDKILRDKTVTGNYVIQSRTPNAGKNLPPTATSPTTTPKPSKPVVAPAPAKIDAEQAKKLDAVVATVQKSSRSAEPFDLNLLNSIKRNFNKTGMLKADDMVKLNTIYKKYK